MLQTLGGYLVESCRNFLVKTGTVIREDVLVVEDLSIRNLTRRAKPKTDIENGNLVYLPNGQSAKSGLNKSMLDAAHGQFANILKYVAWKLGKNVLFVDPKGLLNIVGIASTKSRKNYRSGGILVSVASL